MHIFTSKQRPVIRISVLQSHMRSTYPRQVDSSQNRVAKDVLPTAPSPRRMTSQSMCKNACWLDMDKQLLWLHAHSFSKNIITAYYSLKNWRAYFKTHSTSPQKDGNSFFRDSSWFYSEAPNFFGSKMHHHPSCVEAQETPKVYRYVSLKLHILGLFIIVIFPKPQGLGCRPQRRHLKCLSTWNAREKTTSTWWSSDNHAICLKLGS